MRMLFISGYAAAVLILGIMRGNSGLSRYFELQDSEDKLISTVKEIKEENDQLALEIEKIQNSPSYAQKILRDRYHLVGDDERIIFFSDSDE